MEKVDAISRSPWFQGLPRIAHQQLAKAARVRSYSADSYVYNLEGRASEVYCILSGRVRVSITSSTGREFTVVNFGAEAWIGEVILATRDARMLDVQVVEDARMLSIPRSVVLAVAETYPLMYRNLFHEHVKRSKSTYELLVGMLFYPLRSRLAARMLELIKSNGEEADGGVYLNISLNQNDFARLSMGSRQRINKILREWNNHGIVSIQSDKYFIRDVVALRRERELAGVYAAS